MRKLGIVASVVAIDGQGDAVAERLTQGVADVAAELGTEVYAVFREARNDRTFWLVELYAGQEAMQEHAGGQAVRGLLADLEPLLDGPGAMHVVRPVAAKGLGLDEGVAG